MAETGHTGTHAGPPDPKVDLEHDRQLEAGIGRGPRQQFRSLATVDRTPQRHASGKSSEPLQLGRRHDLISDEQVVDACVGEHFSFRDFRHRDSGRAGCNLKAGDLRHLMRLGVRSQTYAEAARGCCHHVDVGVHPVEIDIEEGRRQVV